MLSNKHHESHGEKHDVTELHVAADGRLYVFGASEAVLEMLLATGIGDESLTRRVARIREVGSGSADFATNRNPCRKTSTTQNCAPTKLASGDHR